MIPSFSRDRQFLTFIGGGAAPNTLAISEEVTFQRPAGKVREFLGSGRIRLARKPEPADNIARESCVEAA